MGAIFGFWFRAGHNDHNARKLYLRSATVRTADRTVRAVRPTGRAASDGPPARRVGSGRRHGSSPGTVFFPEGRIRIRLHARPTDMRKSFDGLSALAKTTLLEDHPGGSMGRRAGGQSRVEPISESETVVAACG